MEQQLCFKKLYQWDHIEGCVVTCMAAILPIKAKGQGTCIWS